MAKKISDEELIKLFNEYGSPQKVAEITGLKERSVYDRRKSIEKKYDIQLFSFACKQKTVQEKIDQTIKLDHNRKIVHTAVGKTIVVASDCHYWPDEVTTAHRAFVEVIKQLKPDSIILNGDVFDGARVSRHDPLYGNNIPTVREEIEACVDRLGEIEKASHNSKLFWLYGNHDTRLWRYTHLNAPELSSINGNDIFDYFPGWHRAYSLHINDNTVVKHRWHNGVHAAYNNALKGGKNVVTGHLHRLCVTPWGDYNGRRYGVDTGTLSDLGGEKFAYLEDNAVPWASGFVVLTYNKDGDLLHPEVCEVIKDRAYFRGEKVL